MISLLIVDNHRLFREGLKQICAKHSDLTVVDEADNDKEVLSLLREDEYDVVVLDISMPGRNGIEVIEQVREVQPDVRVLVVSMFSEAQYAFRAIRAGAAGYLSKSCTSSEFLKAIRRVAAGSKYVSPEVAEQLAFALDRHSDLPLHQRLSNREYQVMSMIASGKTVSAIAEELTLSISTISTVRGRLLNKMNMQTNAEITCYAIRNALVE
ncbi:response regulator transcription factor [bacterium]|nr:response regulator transcription factor [bacterium]